MKSYLNISSHIGNIYDVTISSGFIGWHHRDDGRVITIKSVGLGRVVCYRMVYNGMVYGYLVIVLLRNRVIIFFNGARMIIR